jgi:hypothetical protein
MKLILILLFIGLCLCTNAQLDNLEPEPGFFSSLNTQYSYFPKVKAVLCDSLQYDTEARVVVIPSFSQEYLVSIDSKNGKTYLSYRIAKKRIWKIRSKGLMDCEKYRISFDSSVAKKIHELFFLATSQVKYSNNQIFGEDGITYFFISFEIEYGIRSGFTCSPKTEKMLGLVEVAEWLVDCAKEGKIINQDKMTDKLNKLIGYFKKV